MIRRRAARLSTRRGHRWLRARGDPRGIPRSEGLPPADHRTRVLSKSESHQFAASTQRAVRNRRTITCSARRNGTFSGGKADLPPDRRTSTRFPTIRRVGGNASSTKTVRTGSNRLPMVVRNFRRRIEELGGEYRFECQLEGLDIVDGGVRATAHVEWSDRDEHRLIRPQRAIRTRCCDYRRPNGAEGDARAANQAAWLSQRHKYSRASTSRFSARRLHTEREGLAHDLYLLHVPWRRVIPGISEPSMFCANSMSNSRHDTPFANSGLMVTM